MFYRFVRKPLNTSKLLQWTAIGKVGMGLPMTSKLPHVDLFLRFGGLKVENMNNCEELDFHFQIIKFFLSTIPSSKVAREKYNCEQFILLLVLL